MLAIVQRVLITVHYVACCHNSPILVGLTFLTVSLPLKKTHIGSSWYSHHILGINPVSLFHSECGNHTHVSLCTSNILVVVVVKDISEWLLWVIYVSLFRIVISEVPMYIYYLHGKSSDQRSLHSIGYHVYLLDTWYILCPMAKQKTCWTIISDATYSVFWRTLVRTKVPQCMNPEEDF